jgi:hypothetical protein
MGISKRAAHLMALADAAGVLKKEAQEITHKQLDAAQPAIGDQMQKETESATKGNYASDKSVDAELKGTVEIADKKIEGDDDKKAEKVLAETGTAVDKMYPCGTPAGTPAEVVKSAAFRTRIESVVKSEMAKEAALKAAEEKAKEEQLKKEASAKEEEVTTATEVLHKIASLNDVKSEEDFIKIASDIQVSFQKLQETNPLFNIAVEHKLMEKQAAEIDALAAENEMSPEDAAAALDAAVAEDPEAAAEIQAEAEGEALSDLAGAEQEQAAFMDGLDETAAQVSEMLGQPVSGDDIAQAVSDVVDAAEQMGVEPEVLLEAAAQELMGAGEGDEEPSEEDMAQAQQILDEAAKQGISPEEVIQAVAAEMEGEGGEAAPEAPAEAPAEEPAKEEAPAEDMGKEAAYHAAVKDARQQTLVKLASTRRGANLMKVLSKKA